MPRRAQAQGKEGGGVGVLFATPRKLPRAGDLPGRVVVLDLAFAGGAKQFRTVTLRLIQGLGDRLAAWVDHHEHERHEDFSEDPRFILSTKQEHPSCAEMVTPEIVGAVGAVDTILSHGDLDGIYAAAKWLLGGEEPYPGADRDARVADSRQGTFGEVGRLVDEALRGAPRDEDLKQEILESLVVDRGLSGTVARRLEAAAESFRKRVQAAAERARGYRIQGPLAVVELPERDRDFDKTELLLMGQKLAPVAVVRQGPNVTVAAAFDSGLDLVAILGLKGGMPTRVSVSTKHFEDVLERLTEGVEQQLGSAGQPSGPSGPNGGFHER